MNQNKLELRMNSNHPRFASLGHFLHALGQVVSIFVRRSLDSGPVHRPWVDNRGWLTPAFREKLCLVVSYSNHCVG
jgi:hypothetical protein